MNIRVEKACGIDIHQAFLVATMLDLAGTKDTRRFSTCIEEFGYDIFSEVRVFGSTEPPEIYMNNGVVCEGKWR